MSTDDLNLLQRTRRGDEAAARELWSRFAPRMLAYAHGILGRARAHAAEDVVQSVFVSILAQPTRNLRRIDDVPSWMLRCTRNAALNHLRGMRRERMREAKWVDGGGGGGAGLNKPTNGVRPPRGESVDNLAAAIDALPRRHREPLILKHIAGLTFDQLALALGINRNTAASRYRAALTTLRQSLGNQEVPGENHA
jgi:RNA polymerase sigma-70 factor, ECF subfamily